MDPALTQATADIVTGLGLPGLIILVLAKAVKVLFDKYTDSQEKRITEAADNRAAVERNTSALAALTEWVKERSKG